MMLVIVLFSTTFIVVHVHHNCSGDDCPICACMQQCERTLRGFGSTVPDAVSVYVPLVLIFIIISSQAGSYTMSTPVSEKVRLNN
ncbi:MAG: hypothetical protein K6E49_00045 [Lachnospiraceae bacterium]|nr:hypothetical protein [Lachnospiraceae bacterium]